MRYTNAQRADLIDALKIAAEDLQELIHSSLPSKRSNWRTHQRAQFADWSGRIKRFKALRRELLAEERGDA